MNAKKNNVSQAITRLIVILVGLIGPGIVVYAQPSQQTDNLLANPGFEPFSTPEGQYDFPLYTTAEGGGHIAESWSPWWYNDEGPDYSVPEYDIAPISRDPVRVRSGNAAQQIFRPSVLWEAGVYQRVQVPANAQLRFTIYGHAWAGFCKHDEGGTDCGDNHDSFYGDGANPATMRIGIDPTGGTSWASESIAWSQDYAFYDEYQQLLVEAQAQGEYVTVYTYTTFLYPAVINNVYWDDASLTVIGEGTAPTATAAPAANTSTTTSSSTGGGSSPGVIVTQQPREDGSQWHVVKPGDTLGGIAVAYGTRSQTLRELNSLTSDIVKVGQELLISPAPISEPTATPVVEETEEPTAIAEVQPEMQLGSICVLLFEDTNENSLRDSDEMLLANGTVNLSGATSASYTTDGASEPYCFAELESGDYVASVIPPANYHLTVPADLPITISGGGQVALNFGAAVGEEMIAADTEPAEEEAATTSNGSPIRTILIGGGIVMIVLAVGGGLAAYFLIYKRKNAGI